MESKAKLLGHPIHPMLIVFPVGLLVTAVIFDVVRMLTGDVAFATVAFWCIAAGVIGGLVAAIFGLIDWLNIPAGTRAKTIGMWHGLGNVVVLALFAVSWLLRRGDPSLVPDTLAFVLALAAAVLSVVTSWLGGEMVSRLGVGVDRGAHLDAPSSLSGRPADSGRQRESGSAQPLREREATG
ncbi:MAG: DUF2231 domain-containing protein [Chloroflexota bacterium]|nr:MAG: hypothetical protein DIU80_02470 [Chloroflexota bacterium]